MARARGPRPPQRLRGTVLTLLIVLSSVAVVHPATAQGEDHRFRDEVEEEPPGSGIIVARWLPNEFPENSGFRAEAHVQQFIVGFRNSTGDGNMSAEQANVTFPQPGDTFHGAQVLLANRRVNFIRVFANESANFRLQASSNSTVDYVRVYGPRQFTAHQGPNTTRQFPPVHPTAEGFNSNDPYLDRQWGLHGFPGIDANSAWDIERGDRDVKVAVLDTGLEKGHEDIDRYTQGYDFFNMDRDPDDPCGHGTHVAGTVGALTDNDRGVAGGSKVTVMPVKVLGQPPGGGGCTGSSSALANGITHAADEDADIIVMSLGCPKGCWSQAVADAVDYAHSKGVLLVSSAGNTGPCSDCVGFPANHPHVVAVSALDEDGTLAGYTSTGSEVELIAPGTSILSTYIGNTYGTLSGTSMAAPHVASAAALVLSVQEMSHTELRNHLTATAMDADISALGQGAGAVNALRAVEAATSEPNQPPEAAFNVSCTGRACTFDVGASYDPDGSITSYTWSFGDGATATGPTVTHTYPEAGRFEVELSVTDDGNLTARATESAVTTSPNAPPTAAVTFDCSGLQCHLSGEQSKTPGGTILSYAWDLGDGNTASDANTTHVYDEGGTYNVTLTVTDTRGLMDNDTATLTISQARQATKVLLETDFKEGREGWHTREAPTNLWRVHDACRTDPDGDQVMGFARPAPDCNAGADPVRGWVRTPILQASGYKAVTMSFQHVVGNGTGADQAPGNLEVQASSDGGNTWSTIQRWDDRNATPEGWSTTTINLTDYATDNLTVRWLYEVQNASGNDHAGWFVDDVRVVATAPGLANQPPHANFTWSCEGVSCRFEANGVDGPSIDPDGELVGFSWTLGETNAEGSTLAHTFPAPGTYSVEVTVVDDDGATASVRKKVTVKGNATDGPRKTVLVTQGFESGDIIGWKKSKRDTDLWAITGACAPEPREGWFAAFTRPGSGCNYDVGHARGWLRTPPMNMDDSIRAKLTFSHAWETESSRQGASDLMKVQVSTDGGATWATLREWTSQDPNLNHWRQVEVNLTDHISDRTMVRWLFDSSDGASNHHAGWFVDDVKVTLTARDLDHPSEFNRNVTILDPGEDVPPQGEPDDEPEDQDEPDTGVPGPAVPLVALAVITAGLLLRRRRRS